MLYTLNLEHENLENKHFYYNL